MGWAVIHHTKTYHPEGDPDRMTNEFVYWVHETQQEACQQKASLLLFHRLDRRISVREVEDEAWNPKKKEAKK